MNSNLISTIADEKVISFLNLILKIDDNVDGDVLYKNYKIPNDGYLPFTHFYNFLKDLKISEVKQKTIKVMSYLTELANLINDSIETNFNLLATEFFPTYMNCAIPNYNICGYDDNDTPIECITDEHKFNMNEDLLGNELQIQSIGEIARFIKAPSLNNNSGDNLFDFVSYDNYGLTEKYSDFKYKLAKDRYNKIEILYNDAAEYGDRIHNIYLLSKQVVKIKKSLIANRTEKHYRYNRHNIVTINQKCTYLDFYKYDEIEEEFADYLKQNKYPDYKIIVDKNVTINEFDNINTNIEEKIGVMFPKKTYDGVIPKFSFHNESISGQCIYLQFSFFKNIIENIFKTKAYKNNKVTIKNLYHVYSIHIDNTPDNENIKLSSEYYYSKQLLISKLISTYEDEFSKYYKGEIDYIRIKSEHISECIITGKKGQKITDTYYIFKLTIDNLLSDYSKNPEDVIIYVETRQNKTLSYKSKLELEYNEKRNNLNEEEFKRYVKEKEAEENAKNAEEDEKEKIFKKAELEKNKIKYPIFKKIFEDFRKLLIEDKNFMQIHDKNTFLLKTLEYLTNYEDMTISTQKEIMDIIKNKYNTISNALNNDCKFTKDDNYMDFTIKMSEAMYMFHNFEQSGESNLQTFVGFNIKYEYEKEEPNFDLISKSIKAYDDGLDDKERVKNTIMSTGFNNKCLSNSYKALLMIREKQIIKNNNVKLTKIYNDYYKSLDDEAKKYVNDGNLDNFFRYITKKDKQYIPIVLGYSIDDVMCYFDGELTYININDEKLNNQTVLFYIDRHIDVMGIEKLKELRKKRNKIKYKMEESIKKITNTKLQKIIEKENIKIKIYKKEMNIRRFTLEPQIIKENKHKYTIKVWDIESRAGEGGKQIPSLIMCMNTDGSDTKIFYEGDNINVINEFVNYIDSLASKYGATKTNASKAVNKILLYSLGGTRYDHLLIHKELKKKNYKSSACYDTKSSIKFITYHNVEFVDIGNFYQGSLRNVFKDFYSSKKKGENRIYQKIKYINLQNKLEEKEINKTYFPYKYLTYDTLNYKGPIPEKKYWEKDKIYDKDDNDKKKIIYHYDEYIKDKNIDTYTYDMKKEILEYCFYDCIVLGAIVKKHVELCIGSIKVGDKIKNFDLMSAKTAASLAIKYLKQVFLEDVLEGTNDKDLLEELNNSYFGGFTERFKKRFKKTENGKLYYYDINSAHPNSMTKTMPHVFIDWTPGLSKKFDSTNVTDIIDYHFYKAFVVYDGKCDQYISPILTRSQNGSLLTLKRSTQRFMWGNELKRAIESGCVATVSDIVRFEGKKVFENFVNFCYKAKADYKDQGKSILSNFQKLVLNSSGGKLGQKPKDTRLLIFKDDYVDICDKINCILNEDINRLIDFEDIDDDFLLLTVQQLNADSNNIGSLVRYISFITAETRCNLHRAMENVGFENVYYCDTDSIFTSVKLSDKFLDDKELGKFKLECEIDKAVFIAKKMYNYTPTGKEDKNASKGIKPVDLETSDYEKLSNGEKVKVNCTMFKRNLSNGVNVEEIIRTISQTEAPTRIFIGNDSIPFNSIHDYDESVSNNAYKNSVLKMFNNIFSKF